MFRLYVYLWFLLYAEVHLHSRLMAVTVSGTIFDPTLVSKDHIFTFSNSDTSSLLSSTAAAVGTLKRSLSKLLSVKMQSVIAACLT